jgi:hydrogenase maturation protein HypF
VDDSLIVPHGPNYYFIRRSRGYVPLPVDVNYDKIILGVGAERNVTASVSKSGKLYLSQYIGNTNYYKTLDFLDEASKYLMRLLGITKVDAITLDLHPQYPTRRLATELAERFDVKMYEHQHHWSHATSLMLDNKIDEPIVALTLDGAGYGTDGTVWGGEVLFSTFNDFEQCGSLELIPLIGGDKAVYEPKRLMFGIYEKLGLNSEDLSYFPSGTADVFRKMMDSSPLTSSFGRVLDSLACYFGIAEVRSYDGEPAMKLERYLAKGKPSYEFDVRTTRAEDGPDRIQTLNLFKQLFEIMDFRPGELLPEPEKADLCHSFVNALMKKLVDIGLECAKKRSANYLGITGGVTYNIPIVDMSRGEFIQRSETDGFSKETGFLTHSRLPNGDGGISAGQNAITGALLSMDL